MRINQSVEQGIYVVLMLALQEGQAPVKSSDLGTMLEVSDSYLKKTLRKMVVGGIITSSASKDGGFSLAKPIEQITVYDVYHAVDGGGIGISLSGIAHHIFVDDEKLEKDEQLVLSTFEKATSSYEEELKKLHLIDLLVEEDYVHGFVDWSKQESMKSDSHKQRRK